MYELPKLEIIKENKENRILALEKALTELHKIEQSVQDVLISVGNHLLMDSDFGKAITVLTSELGDNVFRLKLINAEISKKSVTVISGDGCNSIRYDMNGNRISPAYVPYPPPFSNPVYSHGTGDFPFQSPLDTAGKPMSQREEFYKDQEEFYKDHLVNITFCGGHDSVDIDHSNGCSNIVDPPGNLDSDGNCIGKDWPKSGNGE